MGEYIKKGNRRIVMYYRVYSPSSGSLNHYMLCPVVLSLIINLD